MCNESLKLYEIMLSFGLFLLSQILGGAEPLKVVPKILTPLVS